MLPSKQLVRRIILQQPEKCPLGKRVTFLHYRLDTGGIDRVACLLASGFAEAEYQVDLVVFCDQGSAEANLLPLLSKKVNLHYLGHSGGSRTRDLIRLSHRCIDWARKNRPDYLVSTSNNMNAVTAIIAKMSGSPSKVILKTTNPVVRKKDRRIYAAFRKFGYVMAIDLADKVLTLSDAETKLLQRQFPAFKSKFSTVINPYVTPDMLRDPAKQIAVGNRKLVLGIGRFEPQKRFDLLIKAFASLKREDVNLVILGEGQQKQECEALVKKLHLSHQVQMPGFSVNIASWLHQADLLVMTSRYEGLPAVVLEALAANCPVLTTDCFPAAKEMLDVPRQHSIDRLAA
tara:strand:- start:8 stop:1042 length:1035 start_codon:yes stop_codon:yes gene_type:complete